MTSTQSPRWTHRWTFILAATGAAVGLGNIWKFPYITGEYGGGAFVLVYLACILLIGVPIMIAEAVIGRHGRADPVTSMQFLSEESGQSPRWAWIAAIGVLCGLFILMFYSVVAGWALEYVVKSFQGDYIGANASIIEHQFERLTADTERQFMWHTVFALLTGGIVAAGVTRGVGTAVEILMPVLFLFLLVLLVYSLMTGDAAAAARFMFSTDFSKLSVDAVLTAMGHAFFTLSLGMGTIIAYGSYMPKRSRIGNSVMVIALLDTLIALIAGMAIFPLVFGYGLEPGAGPGLLFVTLPITFAQMPGGLWLGSLFFLLISIAALSSSISMIEPGVSWLARKGLGRVGATAAMTITAWLGGILCLNSAEAFQFFDDLTAKYMLPGGGLLIAIFTGWYANQEILKSELAFRNPGWFELWQFVLRYIAPAGVILVFLNSLGLLAIIRQFVGL